MQQQTQVSLDEHRYQQRLKDAARHSLHLLQDFPVDLIKPPLASHTFYTGLSVRREISDPEHLTFDKYRRRLQEFNHEEYCPSPSKKQKVVFQKENHVREQNKRNQNILRRVQKELNGRRDRRRFGSPVGFGIMEKRPIPKTNEQIEVTKKDTQDETASETKVRGFLRM